MLRQTWSSSTRTLLVGVLAAVLAFALVAPATASDRSIFKKTQTYVLRSTPHQDAYFAKFNGAGDYAGALEEANFIRNNAVKARAVLKKQRPSSARGKKGKKILLRYWTVKKRAATQLVRAAEAGIDGDTERARELFDGYDPIAQRATDLLVKGVAFVK